MEWLGLRNPGINKRLGPRSIEERRSFPFLQGSLRLKAWLLGGSLVPNQLSRRGLVVWACASGVRGLKRVLHGWLGLDVRSISYHILLHTLDVGNVGLAGIEGQVPCRLGLGREGLGSRDLALGLCLGEIRR